MVLMMSRPHKDSRGVYHVRRKVPVELRAQLGGEYKRSLRTKDPAEARRLFPSAYQESEECFALARAALAGNVHLSEPDVLQLASRWFREELADMESKGDYARWLVSQPEDGQDLLTGQPIGDVLESISSVYDNDTLQEKARVVRASIEQVMTVHRLPMPSDGSPLYSLLVDVFYSHALTLSDHALIRSQNRGMYIGQPKTVAPHAPIALEQSKAGVGKRMSEVWKSFEASKVADGVDGVTPTTLNEYRGVVNRFIELFGDVQVAKVTPELILDYRLALSKTPSKGDGIRGIDARRQIERAESEGLPVLTAAAIRKRLKVMSTVLNYAQRMGWIDTNPVIATELTKQLAKATAKSKGARRRKGYTPDELTQIFTSPIYSSGWKPPVADLGEALWWLPLLAAYTGARLGELAQLFVSDVRVSPEGIRYLSLLKEEDGIDDEVIDSRRVKCESSRRVVPLHQDLIDLGFMAYVEGLPVSGQVFPRITPNKVGKYAPAFGRIWPKYLRNTAGLDSPAAPMHGFRHAFKTLCRTVGITKEVGDWITGHTTVFVGDQYGEQPLVRMAEEMKKFPSIARTAGLLK